MKTDNTIRGFKRVTFIDSYNHVCSIQESSSFVDSIWLGIDNPELTVFENNDKGKYITTCLPPNWSVNSRMHLDKEQVSALIPLLQNFVDKGGI